MSKLSAATVEVLKNFASINQSLLFKEGNELNTISPQKTIMARVQIPDSIEREFAIYDLSQFLGILSLFKEPELTFRDSYVTVSEGDEKVNYRYADPKLIVTPPAKELVFPDPDVEFVLTADALQKIQKAGSALGVPEVAVVGEDGKITVRALNSKETEGNNYQFKVGKTDREFRAIFKTENLKLIPDEYEVAVAAKGLARFQSGKARYYIAIEAASSF
jgi:hypothetical protein